jgi:hypothetical protein
MALLDSVVNANFRSEPAGRVVVFPGGHRDRGYVVKSLAEERKIKSFLGMFYYAHVATLVLGYLLAYSWARDLTDALGRPALHIYRTIGIFLGVYAVVAGLPYFLLWRFYKKAITSFVSSEDEVQVAARRSGARSYILISAGVVVLGLAIILAFAVSRRP